MIRPVPVFPKFWSGNSSAANPNDGDRWVYNSATGLWEPKAMTTLPVFACSNVDHALTGTLTETELWNCIIPGGTLGPNGIIRITTLWDWTSSANAKYPRIKFGGSLFFNPSATSSYGQQNQIIIRNRNSASSQVALHTAAAPFAVISFGGAALTASINTAVDQALSFTGALANSGETIALKSALVEVLK